MTGAGLRKTALLAALAGAAACCLGSSGGPTGVTAAAAGGGGVARAMREHGPSANAGPFAPKAKGHGAKLRLALPVSGLRPPANGGAVGTAGAAAARDTTYTNPWRYCPGDIQLNVSDGEGCDEWWLAASYVDSGVTHYGMNAVGAEGRGESIWLGWFLCATLEAFAPLARSRGEEARADRWLVRREELRAALEGAGWDGDWYRRGYFDDGSPLGSAANAECRIDSIAQSWAVLSGAANPARAAHAMAAVNEHLVKPREKEVLLFTPPFTESLPNPGYIKSYPAGVRENGGQYTHGSIWSLMAFAALGDGDRAKELFDYFSPIHHTRTPEDTWLYKLEPYAVAADVYAAPAAAGRGGWSWYTGSAAWLYRAALESILGFRVQGAVLTLEPCIPRHWRRFDIEYRHGGTLYRILVTNPFGASSGISHVELDHLTILRPPVRVPLVDDGVEHSIRVVMG